MPGGRATQRFWVILQKYTGGKGKMGEGKVKGNPRQALIAATMGFFIGFAAVALFGPTAHKFKEVMHIPPELVGILVAIPALSGSLLRIPFSAWVDTTGGRKPFLVLLTLSILGMVGLSLTVFFLYPSRLTPDFFPLLLLLGVLCGCGIATFSVGISQVAYWFPRSYQGRALGIYAGVGNLAPGLFSLLLPFALTSLGLSGAYFAWLSLLVWGTIIYWFLGRNAWYFQLQQQGFPREKARELASRYGQELFPSKSTVEGLRISARNWRTWVLVCIYFCTFGGFVALTAWLPTYWNSFFGVGSLLAGILTAAYSLLTSVIRIVGGYLSDELEQGGENTAILALLIMLNGAVLLTLSDKFPIALTGILMMAVGMGVSNAAVFKLLPQMVPEAIGGAAGWVGGLGAFGGFVIPPLMGFAVRSYDRAGYPIGFTTFVALALFSLSLMWILKYAHPGTTEERKGIVPAVSAGHTHKKP